jgi:hypothetical protein
VKLIVSATRDHPRGRVYSVRVGERSISILLTFHSLERMARWALTESKVLEALVHPEEVLRGHRNRFIAHRRAAKHVVRVVYEYEARLPVVLTVYCPYAERYFRGGGTHADTLLA